MPRLWYAPNKIIVPLLILVAAVDPIGIQTIPHRSIPCPYNIKYLRIGRIAGPFEPECFKYHQVLRLIGYTLSHRKALRRPAELIVYLVLT